MRHSTALIIAAFAALSIAVPVTNGRLPQAKEAENMLRTTGM